MNRIPFLRRFHWKMALIRVLINAIVLVVIALLLPTVHFVDPSILSIVLLAVALGVLNALVKPVLQFVLLPLIFASYGLVIVLVNTLLLLLLAWLFPASFAVDNLWWAFAAGALIGLLGTSLENLFGLVPPIVPDEETGLRRKFLDRPVGSLGGSMLARPLSKEEQLVIEAPEDEGQPIQPELEAQSAMDGARIATSAPTVSPSEGSPPEANAAAGHTETGSDAPSSPPDEQPDTPTKEEVPG